VSAPTTPHLAPTDAEVQAALAASRVLVHIAARSIAPIDEVVTLPQYRLLLHLYDESRSGTQLAADLGVNPSTVVRMADRLETKGLLQRRRRPTDRRVAELELTTSGRELIDGVTERRIQGLRTALTTLTPDQRAGLTEHLALLRADDIADPSTDDEAWPL